MSYDSFGQSGPIATSADRKYMKDIDGHLVIVWVAQAVDHHPSPKYDPRSGKKAPMVVADVIDCDNNYEVIPAMWITGALCYAWRKGDIVGGKPLLGRMRKTGPDQLAPWTFDQAQDPADMERGLAWLRANSSFIRTGADSSLEVPFADPFTQPQQPWGPPQYGFQGQPPAYPPQQPYQAPPQPYQPQPPAWNQQNPAQGMQAPYHPQQPIQQPYQAPQQYSAPAPQQPGPPPGSPMAQWQQQQNPQLSNQHIPGQFNPVTGQPQNLDQQRQNPYQQEAPF